MIPWRKLQAGLSGKATTKDVSNVIQHTSNIVTSNFTTNPTLVQNIISKTLYGDVVIGVLVVDGSTSVATGDANNGNFFRIPSKCDEWNIVSVAAQVFTAGSTGTTDLQLRNVTDGTDVLSTKITIDSGEKDSLTAATLAVIDTNVDDVVTGDQFTWDVDAIQSITAPKGLYCEVVLKKPT